MKLFRNESGFALPLALLVMVTTSAILVTAITTTSSTGRTANLGKTAVSAEALAEAGLANGIAILGKPGQDMNDPNLFPHTLATAITYTIDGGTAKLWGVYDTANYVWTLSAQGSLPNPTGGAAITKTLSRTTQVLGIAAGATVPEWSRFIYDDASTCFTIDTVTIPGAVASRGPMCLKNGGNVAVNSTGAATTVGVGTNLTVEAPNVTSPARTAPSTAGAVTGTGWTNALYNYLSTSDTLRSTYSIPCCNALSNNLDAKGMFNSPVGNNIPTTAIIRGIQVDIIRNASATLSLRDEDVFLLKAGVASGTDEAATGTDWGTTDATATYGGPTDLWGTTWTPAQHQRDQLRRSAAGEKPAHLARAYGLDQPDPRDRHVHRRRYDPGDRGLGEPDRERRHRRHVQAQQQRHRSLRQRQRRLGDDGRGRAAAARQAADRSRLVVEEREARPQAPLHRAGQHLPEHVRQRLCDHDSPQQQCPKRDRW